MNLAASTMERHGVVCDSSRTLAQRKMITEEMRENRDRIAGAQVVHGPRTWLDAL